VKILFLLGVGVLVLTAHRAGGAGVEDWTLTLDKAADGKPLKLHLRRQGGQVVAAFASGYNSRPHDVDISDLKADGDRIGGKLKVKIAPDPWLPADRKSVDCAYAVDMRASERQISGTFNGAFGANACEGAVTGTVAASAQADTYRRFRIRFFNALYKLWQAGGPNASYALDMNLIFPVTDGKVGPVQFETIVPDYRRYSAIVQEHDLRLDGHLLVGTVKAMVDTGDQGSGRAKGPRQELHVYTLRGMVIGGSVAGVCETRVGEVVSKNERFLGTVGFDAPPKPSQSIAFVRLHGAMREAMPVILNLSLNDGGPIHGFAWCPGYNHQPHGVDASGLKLAGQQLAGTVRVTITPDCYRPPEHFSMDFTVDATVSGAEVAGSFAGDDRGHQTKGAITGELRPRKPPTVGMANLASAELSLGYCLVGGGAPHQKSANANHAVAKLTFEDGKLTAAHVVHPTDESVYSAKVDSADLKIDGDRLVGSLVFTIASKALSEGQYHFTFDATISGDALSGFWRAKHKGQDVLTKSAKLGGKLVAAK
jgi:hypothetical protein